MLFLLCSFSVFFAAGQDLPLRFRGKIVDEHNISIPYATVSFLSTDRQQKVAVSIADADGVFEVRTPLSDSLVMSVSVVTFKIHESIIAGRSQDLGMIRLKPDHIQLTEVNIKAERPLVTRKVDRYVLNIADSQLSTGRTSFELLNFAPGVITIGGSISINGKAIKNIMVNGKIMRMSQDQVKNYLDNLRAEEVASVEVIPNPGAEFEAEGAGGLINIVLKKKKTGGFNGSLTAGAQHPVSPSYNGGTQLNYGYKSLQLFGSYSHNKGNSRADLEDIRTQTDAAYTTKAFSKNSYESDNVRLGAGYDINLKQSFGLEYSGNFNNSLNNTISEAALFGAGQQLQNKINGDFLNYAKNKLSNFSLNYDWKIDTLGSNIKVLADYLYSDRYSRGDFLSKYRNGQNELLFDSIYNSTVPTSVKNYNLASDFTKIFKNNSSFKAGFKLTSTRTINEVIYQYQKNGVYFFDESRSNLFEYKERIAAVYGQYSFKFLGMAVQTGLRAEHTATKGITVSTGDVNSRSYFNLFPSLFMSKDFDKDNAISFNYSRRFDRPSFSSLNPFEWRIDDYTYITGNPVLNPQFTNSYNLSYSFLEKYELTFFASQTKGVFGQLLSSGAGNGVTANYRWENLNEQNNFGMSLYLPVKVTRYWSMVNSVLFYRNSYLYDNAANRKTIFTGKSLQNFTIVNDFKAEISGYYQSSYNISNQVFVPNYYIDFGLSNKFFKKRVNARVLMTDVFNSSKMDYRSTIGSLLINEKQKYLTRRIALQLTYNFDLGSKIRIRKVDSGNSEDKGRIK